jgi:hypothetical protein
MTTEAYELPELPEQVAHLHSNGSFCSDRQPPGIVLWPLDLFTEAQMREYARLAVKQERERYVLSYMALAEAMGYNERGRENELESPEEYAARLFSAAIRAG